MNTVTSIQEKRMKKEKPHIENLNEVSNRINELEETLNDDVGKLNKESRRFHFEQLFNKMKEIKEADDKYTNEYNKAYHTNKKPMYKELEESLKEGMDELYNK